MIYLHDGHIRDIGINWHELTYVVESTLRSSAAGNCVHPLKPYLRYGDRANRIIAMPAYVGEPLHLAGIKWIASFPGNHALGLPRAHNTLLLNDASTGKPTAFFQSGLLNCLRTAAVSGVMTTAFLKARPLEKLRVGIIGWGPIGRAHLEMFIGLFEDRLDQVMIYDLKPVAAESIPESVRSITLIADYWQSVYRESAICATCTVSPERYIDQAPPRGSLLLNVSLRDYLPESVSSLKAVVVDDWQEICRENTDIEQLHLTCGLREEDAILLEDVVCGSGLADYASSDEPVFFNPMGLAVFDIAIAGHYLQEAVRLGAGVVLEDG
ncbi:2,3-diaminopropionate biosynthesis protein SbnB [Paenibacillus gansuensis]|uniref:2,3-diaminopropionate biosynthesis protein SbnB n=1 Tax=Paenibacillus gansuensis TaxID=306542 RepID=A0ABW5PLU4_9BACL